HSPYKIFEYHLVVGHHQLWTEEFQGEEQRGDAILAARKRDDDTGWLPKNLLQERWLVKQGRQFELRHRHTRLSFGRRALRKSETHSREKKCQGPARARLPVAARPAHRKGFSRAQSPPLPREPGRAHHTRIRAPVGAQALAASTLRLHP